MTNNGSFPTAPEQLRLDLEVAAEREIDGVGMGVLSDGTPYLTIRGLARMCGVDHTIIIDITSDWIRSPLKPREMKIRELVRAQRVDDSIAFIALSKNGTIYHAIPAAVCMAILEYYAFESKKESESAAKNYRILARKGFNDFIYAQVGYNPDGSSELTWQQFHDRVTLSYHTVPAGYFSVFKEMADVIVTMIRGGANLGSKFIPDISVGVRWGKYWTKENLDVIYGERIKYDHNYPMYFPQSASNPQPAFAYPDDALAEFRKWMRESYIPNGMPAYLNDKVRDGQISGPIARKALDAFAPQKGLPRK